jgi:hypothetical protein
MFRTMFRTITVLPFMKNLYKKAEEAPAFLGNGKTKNSMHHSKGIYTKEPGISPR